MRILITGVAGNLGSFLTHHLIPSNHDLHLLFHQTELSSTTNEHANVSAYKGDLAAPDSLYSACKDVDCLVHFAGVLFAPYPEDILPVTNVHYVKNPLNIAVESRINRFILISFPHVEGKSTPDQPALRNLNGIPKSIHAQTRLAAEKHLFDFTSGTTVTPVALRSGMIYGRGY
jgi:nucleoside-diphosphate-sugar epimerase